MPRKAQQPEQPEQQANTLWRVRALRDGFRRCGRAWPAAGETVPESAFSVDDWARLRAEPMLSVIGAEAEG